jgi:hypothetical protein
MDASSSLFELFAHVPDPRQRQGRRHPLPAILGLTALALLAGRRSLEAIAQYGRDLGPDFARALGFTHPKTPAKSTFSEVFRVIDIGAYESALRRWLRRQAARKGWRAIALDGKTLCGTTGERVPGVHLLAASAHEARIVLAQMRVDAKTDEHKAALELLDVLPLKGAVVTADAMFTHADFCREVRKARGDYVLAVKDNQPTLLADLQAAFAADAAVSPLPRAPATGRSDRGDAQR